MNDDTRKETREDAGTPPAPERPRSTEEEGASAAPAGEGPEEKGSPGAERGAEPLAAEAFEDLRKKAAERDALVDELRRARADLDNLQKRIRRERPAWEDQAVRRFIRDLLPVLDNFERAMQTIESAEAEGGSPASILDGVRLIHQMMRRVLREHGIEEIEALGRQFDPELHEAMVQERVPGRPTGEILEVLERGYRQGDVVVRPSKVKVAVNAKEAGSEAEARKSTE